MSRDLLPFDGWPERPQPLTVVRGNVAVDQTGDVIPLRRPAPRVPRIECETERRYPRSLREAFPASEDVATTEGYRRPPIDLAELGWKVSGAASVIAAVGLVVSMVFGWLR